MDSIAETVPLEEESVDMVPEVADDTLYDEDTEDIGDDTQTCQQRYLWRRNG